MILIQSVNISFRHVYLLILVFFYTHCGYSSSKDNNEKDFKIFINHFLETTFWGQNIDSLALNACPTFTQFLEPSIGFGCYWNPGIYCVFFDSFNTTSLVLDKEMHNRMPAYKPLDFFANQMPVDGFCEESKSKDGIYFTAITAFPSYPDLTSEDYLYSCEPYLPARFTNCPKMDVVILLGHYIIKHLYFIKIDKKWYVTSFYDCDCSA